MKILIVAVLVSLCGCPLTQVQRDTLQQHAIDCTKLVRDQGFKQVSDCALAALAQPCDISSTPECWVTPMLQCAETKGIADAISIAICEIGVAGEAIAYEIKNMGGGPDLGEFNASGALVKTGKLEQLSRVRVMQKLWPVKATNLPAKK